MKTKFFTLIMLVFFLTSCGLNTTLNTEASNIKDHAALIADFELPANYHPEFSVRFQEYTLVSFKTEDPRCHLYLIQSENQSDAEKLAELLEDLAPGDYDTNARMEILTTQNMMVRDQEGLLVISTGTSSEGTRYQQAMLSFQGNSGPALLIFSEPDSRWDQEKVEALLTSIH